MFDEWLYKVRDTTLSVVQGYGEGILWWSIKNVDYFQPELRHAANDYSWRFDSQVLGSAGFLLSRSNKNPLYKILETIIVDMVRKYGEKKVKDAIIKTVGDSAVTYVVKTLTLGVIIGDWIELLLESVIKSSSVAFLVRNASGAAISFGMSLQAAQFHSAKDFIWLARKNEFLARKLYNKNLDALFFLVKPQYVKLEKLL